MKKRTLKGAGLALVAVAGVATAALVGVALATTFTLKVAKDAKVVNFNTGAATHENIVVAGVNGHAVYTLSGDSKTHQKCTAKNHCFKFWPPVTVKPGTKPTKAAGIKGTLSTWHRDGFYQVLLAGHPLYFFYKDTKAHVATGEAIRTFGGTWHVVKADMSGSTTSSTSSTMSTSTTTTTVPCIPSPGYPCP